ncbi:NADP-dependent oxidoreductase [Streptomyces sp. NPDC005485]|uniref:NADP-dependent oxidoreductase n=1 Tax=Streptomyces sp. NPDC005485 TaxID=3155591 RepID=UPI0033B20C3C
MTTMKRIQYHQYGGPEVMRFEDFEPRRPGSGEVRVRVRAAAANPMDWGLRGGHLKVMTGRKFPRGVGNDFAGVVEAVGDGVTRLSVGDEVLGLAGIKASGAFAEVVVAEEEGVVKKPANLSWEEAAAIPTVGLTAVQAMVNKGKLRAGQAVFIHGCLGGVGRAAAQIALMHDVSVAGSCRGTAIEEAHGLGITPVVDFDFDATKLAGRFDVVFDTAGTLPISAARTLLRPGGRIIDINPTPAKFVRSAMPGPYQVLMAKTIAADIEEAARAAGKGTLRLPIARTVPLSEAIPALKELERNRTPKGGKLIITID